MKKILFIVFSIFLFSGIYAQNYKTYKQTGTVTLTASSNDTVYVFSRLGTDFVMGAPWVWSFKYSLSTTDVKVGVIVGTTPSTCTEILDATTGIGTITLDGTGRIDPVGRSKVKVKGIYNPDALVLPAMGIEIITTSAVTGTIDYEFDQILYYK
jgi:hypothetical protein